MTRTEDDKLDQLVAQALGRESEALATPDLAARIALDAAAEPQQAPVVRQRARPAFYRPAWLVWPSAAALAASALIGFFAGTGVLQVEDYVPFQDPLAAIDRDLAALGGFDGSSVFGEG